MNLNKVIRPNNFTHYLGDAIRNAREKLGLSQAELAELIFTRRATLSDIENGKTEPDASTLSYLARSLGKPISYFFSPASYKNIKPEDLNPLESELLIHFQQIWDDQLKQVVIFQVKAIAEFDPTQTLLNAVDLTISEKENETKLHELIKQMRKN
ncbi:MAG: hypothetical protein A2X25_06815 [Chloroflexi bacterium GWB2_49_20]|nr:MAG: hypothetical protein A2X25_06815 [Chloroflexi bacterium GWB2_49_20]OGN80249.1 MAG: hypothetical protein A2X26_07960 [Chloroflexi bacterium GWC2_49_37]OGN86110.1 MAG: hypothetical protein A2X27_00780 [Chloroflexi bacterium GWD2_49_16]HCC79415.1 hypothetical protein [Anaerolineae bacterium]HCM96364.1 hypothetical protein [Anaerolineae bacterium]